MPSSANPRNVHLHLVDISAGWHICKSLTVAEFAEYRQTQVYTEEERPLEELGQIRAAAVSNLSLMSAGEVAASDPFAMNGFMLLASYIEAMLREEVEPSHYVKAAGDWLLAIVSPGAGQADATILLTDFIERHGEVPLSGESLDHAVGSLLLRGLPLDGIKLEGLQVHARWAQASSEAARLM